MSTQELIQTELTRLDEAGLKALYPVIRQFVETHQPSAAPAAEQTESLLTRLARIQIDGPEDLSTHHDQYASGAKRA
jgi:hypothetical protein